MNMVEVGTEMIKQLHKLRVGETLLVKRQTADDHTVLVHIGKGTLVMPGIRYQYEIYEGAQGVQLRGLLTLTEVIMAELMSIRLDVGSEVMVSNDEVSANLVVQEVLGGFSYVAQSSGQVTFREMKTTECWDA